MKQENEIRIDQLGDVTLLDIRGDVTTLSEPFLKEAYENANDQGATKIVMKFAEDAYINSGGIAVLMQILAETRRNAQQIGITGLTDHYKKIFNMVGITKFAKIYDTIDEALEGLADPE